ncbi:hypothetical protein D3C71_1491590 [compost metagenome]
MVGLEAAQFHFHCRQLEAMAQNIKGAALLQLTHQLLYQHTFWCIRVSLGEPVPTFRPGVFKVSQHIFGIQCRAAVVAAGRTHQPALSDQGVDDVLLELRFLAARHYTASCSNSWDCALAGGCQARTSILPVTAAEIRAERRSCRYFSSDSASPISESKREISYSKNLVTAICSSIGGTGIFIFAMYPELKFI